MGSCAEYLLPQLRIGLEKNTAVLQQAIAPPSLGTADELLATRKNEVGRGGTGKAINRLLRVRGQGGSPKLE